MAAQPTPGFAEPGARSWLAPAETLVLARSTGLRQPELDFGSTHLVDLIEVSEEILNVCVRRGPRTRPARTIAVGPHAFNVYLGGQKL